MTSSNGNIFRVTGPLCGKFTGPSEFPAWALMFSLIYARINDWVNNREAGDLRRYLGHYNVSVMYISLFRTTRTEMGHQKELMIVDCVFNSKVCHPEYVHHWLMMTSWHERTFLITGPLWGHVYSTHQGSVMLIFDDMFLLNPTNCRILTRKICPSHDVTIPSHEFKL